MTAKTQQADYKRMINLWNNILKYPENAMAFFKELPDRECFIGCEVIKNFLEREADILDFEEERLVHLSPKDREAVINALPKQINPSLASLTTYETAPATLSAVAELPTHLNGMYAALISYAHKTLVQFKKDLPDLIYNAGQEYKKTKPTSDMITERAQNLSDLIYRMNDPNIEKGHIPAYEVYNVLSTLDFFERQKRLNKLRAQLMSCNSFIWFLMDNSLEGIAHKQNHHGQRLSDSPQILPIKKALLKKERLIREKIAAEHHYKGRKENKKRRPSLMQALKNKLLRNER